MTAREALEATDTPPQVLPVRRLECDTGREAQIDFGDAGRPRLLRAVLLSLWQAPQRRYFAFARVCYSAPPGWFGCPVRDRESKPLICLALHPVDILSTALRVCRPTLHSGEIRGPLRKITSVDKTRPAQAIDYEAIKRRSNVRFHSIIANLDLRARSEHYQQRPPEVIRAAT